MEIIHIQDRLDLYYPAEEREAAGILDDACRRSVEVIRKTWGLEPRGRCRVFLMTSWFTYFLRATPWYVFPLLCVFFPLFAVRVRRLWKFAGGWTQRYRNAPVVGVKPPRLISASDTTIGKMLYVHEPDPDNKLRHITCHELTHAFSAHLKLPVWLNEGIAMVSVDRFFETRTVLGDSLRLLEPQRRKHAHATYRNFSSMKPGEIAYHYARAYWMTRFLEERHPEILRELLATRYRRRRAERRLARALGLKRRRLWKQVDAIILRHFGEIGQPQATGDSPEPSSAMD